MIQLRDQLQASLGDAYIIERELGGGGMSRVFVARDSALGRRVVVKVLPEDLSGAVSIARFRREIAVAARLQHPHIVPVLAAGEVNGLPYYTMPFVEGESLREVLAREKLSFPQMIAILRDVAKALDFAHSKGIAHRDIKPANVLIAGTSALIADFGVAKALSDAASGSELTSAGSALGTPAYMAPEQAAGDPDVDGRADIYAFGSMAYEMISGQPPFGGRSLQRMMAAQVSEDPQAISAIRPDTPPSLASLVMKCLEKDPASRPQNATEILHELDGVSGGAHAPPESYALPQGRARRSPGLVWVGAAAVALVAVVALGFWWRARSVKADIHSIAVLPFENTSGDSTFDYLEDGISDQVRDALNALPALTVRARSSSRNLAGVTPGKIGSKLSVGAVLQGTVSRSRDRLHVTAELVRTSDDVALWSNTFDGEAAQLAGIQDKIATAVVSRLGIDRSPSAAVTAGPPRGTSSIEAYDRFLRGRYASDRQEWSQASEYFQAAVRIDPQFARAYGYLAMSYGNEPLLGVVPIDSLNALATATAARAIALDSTTAGAYVAQAYVLLSQMRFGDAIGRFEKSARFDSTNADILSNYALALTYVDRLDEAEQYGRRGRDLDPLSSISNGIFSLILYMAGRYTEAIEAARHSLDMDPKNLLAYQGLGYYFAFNGMPDSAVTTFETASKINPDLYFGRANLVFGYAAAGRWDDAARQRSIVLTESNVESPNLRRAVVYIAFGEYDAAVAAIDRAITAHETMVGVSSLACDPLFDPLKSKPRFSALLSRIGARACPVRARWPIGHPPTR